jgi:hypothetical protein
MKPEEIVVELEKLVKLGHIKKTIKEIGNTTRTEYSYITEYGQSRFYELTKDCGPASHPRPKHWDED